jgi:hypothetical protein
MREVVLSVVPDSDPTTPSQYRSRQRAVKIFMKQQEKYFLKVADDSDRTEKPKLGKMAKCPYPFSTQVGLPKPFILSFD